MLSDISLGLHFACFLSVENVVRPFLTTVEKQTLRTVSDVQNSNKATAWPCVVLTRNTCTEAKYAEGGVGSIVLSYHSYYRNSFIRSELNYNKA